MKTSKKLTLLLFVTLFCSILILLCSIENTAIGIITQAKESIHKEIDVTNAKIKNKIKKTVKSGKKIRKTEVIRAAKNLQEDIKQASAKIKNNIEKISGETNPTTRIKIKDIISQTKKNIKYELKKAYKDIRKQVIKILKKKNKRDALTHAKNIQNTTDETSKIIKQNVDNAFEAIKST